MTSNPPPSPHPNGGDDDNNPDRKPSKTAPALADPTKKKSRLQWDEENLIHNAAEMERAGPRMKIDEPKTPFNMLNSENGSSTSGSAHQSPPESPSFIPRDRLVGFGALEQGIRRRNSTGNNSDGASSASSAGRSVHIDDNLEASAGSSPRSRELFAARRRAHYRNEARVKEWIRVNELNDDDDDDHDDNPDNPDNDDDDDTNNNYCPNTLQNGDPNCNEPVHNGTDGSTETENVYNYANNNSVNGAPASNGPPRLPDGNIRTNGMTADHAYHNGSSDIVPDQASVDPPTLLEPTVGDSSKLHQRRHDQMNGCKKVADVGLWYCETSFRYNFLRRSLQTFSVSDQSPHARLMSLYRKAVLIAANSIFFITERSAC